MENGLPGEFILLSFYLSLNQRSNIFCYSSCIYVFFDLCFFAVHKCLRVYLYLCIKQIDFRAEPIKFYYIYLLLYLQSSSTLCSFM